MEMRQKFASAASENGMVSDGRFPAVVLRYARQATEYGDEAVNRVLLL